MKKTLLIIIPLIIYNLANSQETRPTSKSAILIGGGASGGWQVYNLNQNEDRTNVFYFSLSPSLGYFVKDNLALGASSSTYLYSYTDSESVMSLGFAPFIKNYFENGFVLNGSAGYNFILNKENNDNDITNNLSLSIGFGYALFLNSKVSLELYILDNLLISLNGGNNIMQNNLHYSIGLYTFL